MSHLLETHGFPTSLRSTFGQLALVLPRSTLGRCLPLRGGVLLPDPLQFDSDSEFINSKRHRKSVSFTIVPGARVELATYRSSGGRSNQLSYPGIKLLERAFHDIQLLLKTRVRAL